MKIGVDIDDVLVECQQAFLAWLKKEKDLHFDFESLTDYYIQDWLDADEQVAQDYLDEFYTSGAFSSLPFLPQAKQALETLQKSHDVVLITSRGPSLADTTRRFFEDSFDEWNLPIFHSGDVVEGNKKKADICLDEGVEIMVEDNGHFAQEIAQKNITVFLIDKPWNRECPLHEHIRRVHHWEEILEEFIP